MGVFESYLGIRQGEHLFLLVYVNDMKPTLIEKRVEGVVVKDLLLQLLLYANDSILIYNNRVDFLPNSLDRQRWRLYVNVAKTTVMVFRRGGRL